MCSLKILSSGISLVKVGSFGRSLLKGKALRFSAYFDHPLSCERPFKCWRHLIEDLKRDELTSIYCTVRPLIADFLWLNTDVSNSTNTSFGEQLQWRGGMNF
jgi:hypothetical protein